MPRAADTREQVLVEYVGDEPVFATLETTGKQGHETTPGVFQVWRKMTHTSMRGSLRILQRG